MLLHFKESQEKIDLALPKCWGNTLDSSVPLKVVRDEENTDLSQKEGIPNSVNDKEAMNSLVSRINEACLVQKHMNHAYEMHQECLLGLARLLQ